MFPDLPLVSLLLLLSLSLEVAATYPDPFSPANWPAPEKVTGDPNGWGALHVHDLSLIYHNGLYYSFTTHDLVAIGKSRSLSGYWTHAGSVLRGESTIPLPGRNDTWAPDVHKVGHTFYCYYSVSTFGSQTSAIGLATSKTLEAGSWTDHGAVFESSANATSIPANITNAIDPNLFVDPATGNPWLTYGSFFGDIWQLPLTKDMAHVAPTPAAVQLSIDPVVPRPEEGAYLSYHEPWYYLWFSHGICCGYATTLPPPGAEYSIRVGRSRNARGPFVDRDGTLLTDGGGYVAFGSHDSTYGPGGQGVLTEGLEGRDVLYYHYFDKAVSVADEDALLGWNFLEYIDGWPVLVGR